jgi:short-subunit dehydrogenase
MAGRGSGVVINIASLLAFSTAANASFLPKRAVYAASKSFLVTFSRLIDAEVSGHGVRVQVVCPGVVRTEFHTRQGMDISQIARMEPEDVVAGSLSDLERGVMVSIPGVADTDPLQPLDAAESVLMGAARTANLAERYSRS